MGRRVLGSTALAVLLVVSGCGGKKDGDAQGPPSTNADGTPFEVDDGKLGASADGKGGAGSNGTTTTKPASGGATTTTTSMTSTTRPQSVPDNGARGGPGAFARTLLRPQPATRIVVELLVQPGADPLQGSIDHLLQVLADESRKPVTSAERVSLPGGDGTTTADDIRTWSDRYGRVQQTTDQAVLRVLFLKGRYFERTDDPDDDDGASALGAAVRGDTLAIFKDTVRSAATPIVSASVIEDAVLIHELGHLFGLVDLVLHTGREDPQHRGHSTNQNSVMYWAVEADVVGQVLGGPPSRHFDNADKADLAALRGGA